MLRHQRLGLLLKTKAHLSVGLLIFFMEKKKILFVCVENSNRSQISEAFAKIYGKGTINSYSAGSSPSGKINPQAIAL
jgi:hypothetical protein